MKGKDINKPDLFPSNEPKDNRDIETKVNETNNQADY